MSIKEVLPRSTAVDVLNNYQVYFYCRDCTRCQTANCRHRSRVMAAMLERQSAYTWEQPHKRDFWEVIDFTEKVWIQNFRMIQSTFDELCNAVGLPATSCPREPLPTEKRVV